MKWYDSGYIILLVPLLLAIAGTSYIINRGPMVNQEITEYTGTIASTYRSKTLYATVKLDNGQFIERLRVDKACPVWFYKETIGKHVKLQWVTWTYQNGSTYSFWYDHGLDLQLCDYSH